MDDMLLPIMLCVVGTCWAGSYENWVMFWLIVIGCKGTGVVPTLSSAAAVLRGMFVKLI